MEGNGKRFPGAHGYALIILLLTICLESVFSVARVLRVIKIKEVSRGTLG